MKKTKKPSSCHAPSTIVFSEDGKTKLLINLDFLAGSDIEEDPRRVELKLENFGGDVKAYGSGIGELDPSGRIVIYPQELQTPEIKPLGKPAPRKRVFPCSIAYLSSLPGERCGISTYTQFLSGAVSKHYHTGIYRDIHSGVPGDALIHSQIEFGIFPDEHDLFSDGRAENYKVATWHTVIKNPHQHHLQYCHAIDQNYDAHIVHTILGKKWLSKYVSKPVHLIPHGCVVWDQIDRLEARKRLGLPLDAEIAFCFGFGAKTKGFDEAVEVARRLERREKFKLIISGAVHGVLKEHGRKVLRELRGMAGKNVLILGRYLSEGEINLYASACDVLIFNYSTPSYVSSASGALKRVLAAGRPIVGPYDNRLEELVDGYHILKFGRGDLDDFEQTLELVLTDEEVAKRLGENCRILAEQTSWERTAEKHMEVYGETVGGFSRGFYDDKAYFDVGPDEPGKIYRTADGEVKRWGYVQSSTKNWLGWIEVVKGLRNIFGLKPEHKILDAGTGCAGFVHFARKAGLDCRGCDFSPYAVEHAFRSAKGHVDLADVRDLPYPNRAFYLVTLLDLLEHCYSDDLPRVVSEAQRVSSKWLFLLIGSEMQDDKGEFVLKKGQLPPKEMLGTSIAGHVTVMSRSKWKKKLSELLKGKWRFRDDLVDRFREVVPKKIISNWRNILIVELVE